MKEKIHSPQARIRYLKAVLKDIYGEDRFEVKGEILIECIIHFPHIKITNEIETEHDIYDLYVRFEFINAPEKFLLHTIKTIRTTFSYNEINVFGGECYIHSHLPLRSGLSSWKTDGFCFGSTHLSSFITRMRSNSYIVRDLPMLFISFNSFIEWESLEGKPYFSINSLGDNLLERKNIYEYEEVVNSITEKVMSDTPSFTYKFEGDERIVISGVDELIRKVAKKLKIPSRFNTRMYKERPVRMKINSLTKRLVNKWNNCPTELYFKGEQKIIKILPFSTKELTKSLKPQLHPVIIENVRDRIAESLYEYLTITYKH